MNRVRRKIKKDGENMEERKLREEDYQSKEIRGKRKAESDGRADRYGTYFKAECKKRIIGRAECGNMAE